MSIWEFNAATGGFAKANNAGEDMLTAEQADRLSAWIDEPPIWH